MALLSERRANRDCAAGSSTTMAFPGRKTQNTDKMKITSRIVISTIALTATALFANAQDNNNNNQGRGNRGGTPEEFRARMEERTKTSLKVTEDEWSVLKPLIEKVTTAQRSSMSSRFGGFGGRGGPGGGGDRGGDRGGNTSGNTAAGTTATGGGDRGGSSESQALRDALEKDSTSAEDLKAKLNAIRESRKKAATELAAAREDLKKVVSVRQEAVLFSMGILE